MLHKSALTALLCSAVALGAAAQNTNPNETSFPDANGSQNIKVEPMNQTPVFRVNVAERTTSAVNYRARTSSKVNLQGTNLAPQVTGQAKVDSKQGGRLEINTTLEKMPAATSLGPEYLTYVLWAITPEGRPVNLGEVLPNDDGKVDMRVTTDLQAFGLIVTAEPYFSVTRPSDEVVAENIVRRDTKGWEQPIVARYQATERGEYTADLPPAQLPATTADRKKVPLELLEARNAVAIAKAEGAQQYAPDALARAQDFLDRGEDYLRRKQSRGAIGTVARGAAQQAEDARVIAIRRKAEERAAAERQRLQENEQAARQQAELDQQRAAAAQAQAQSEAQQRQQAEQDRQAAEQARAQAEQAAQQAAQERAAAEQARQQAIQQQQLLAQQADQARQQAAQAEQQREELRARLMNQLNQVLQTRDSARGLIVNMSDVLFDTNKATLRPGARERLAKVAGIILAYPDLRLQIEGHTDSTGTDQYNMTLSERRAEAVRDYLSQQGVNMRNMSAEGLGKTQPIATNATPQGRQMNRRVELVVSGEAIATTASPGTPANGARGTAGTTGAIAGTPGTSTVQTTTTRTTTTRGATSIPAATPTAPGTNQPGVSQPVGTQTSPAPTQPTTNPPAGDTTSVPR